jgi:peptidoglycan/xylan/chitin deacetylase (PgdA/CDA1 family)
MNRSSVNEKMLPAYAARPRGVAAYLCLKRFIYRLCKMIGLFHLADRLTRRGLRIICYHGFTLADESSFAGRTFIDPDTFDRRLAFLQKKRFQVMGLDEALDALDRDALPPRSIVITIDDGFESVYSLAHPVLKRYGFPATVYVTTYYALKQNPVFNLVAQYLFWKPAHVDIDLTGLGMARGGRYSLRREEERTALLWEVVRFGNNECDEKGRVELARKLGERLGVEYDALVSSRALTIMTLGQVRELSLSGIDIELHTHRHVFPLDRNSAIGEIRENRAVLEPLLGKKLVHFCYPAGVWAREQWSWLAEEGIRSAVTTDRGINFRETPRYALKRFGDDERLSQIEFEAEAYGFAELIRAMKRGFRFS